MFEAAIFLFVAYLIKRCAPFSKAPKLRDHCSVIAMIASSLDDGPFHIKPYPHMGEQHPHQHHPKRGTEDPNTNPHYIWNNQ